MEKYKRLWNELINKITENEVLVSTSSGLWFSAYMEDGGLFVRRTDAKEPSCRISRPRSITREDFLIVSAWYEQSLNGCSGARQKAFACSQNASYINGLLSKFNVIEPAAKQKIEEESKIYSVKKPVSDSVAKANKTPQHLSIRVPWHDNGHCGKICNNPGYNNACLRLKNISENRDDALETALAGQAMVGYEEKLCCIGEGGAFMSTVDHLRKTVHPYKKSNKETHGHFLETDVPYPAYSFPARPFRWMMKDRNGDYALAERYHIDYNKEREPELKFKTNWMQDADNHRGVFNYFYQDIIPDQSLCIAYAKQVPFIEDARRVVLGLGFVKKVIPAVEHNHTDQGDLRSMVWETMICHSIREDRKNGFVFPYRELMAYAETHPDFDMRQVTVFASDAYFEEFSYATEHLSYDAVIDVLLQSLKVLAIIRDCVAGDWDTCIKWVNARLTEVWQDRGAYPGLGAMLCAANFKLGILIAREFKKGLNDGDDFWEQLDRVIVKPNQYFSPEIAKSITSINQKSWSGLKTERKTLFQLLARFALTLDQATVLYNVADRKKYELECTDQEIIENPYILYEQTRDKVQFLQIAVSKVDMGVFPPLEIREKFPLAEPSGLSSDNDERRIRAIAVSLLEKQAENGHTVYPCDNLVLAMNDLPIEPMCAVSQDILDSIGDFLKKEIVVTDMKNHDMAYQLMRLSKIDGQIRTSVNKRINTNKRHVVDENWDKIVDAAFGKTKDTEEKRARQEKAAILKELAEARFSVLIGGAGTGKTTLLALLCSSERIKNGGVLLLAPTGKARVKMSQAMAALNVESVAKTVAQFLLQNDRFDSKTMRYHLSDKSAKDVPDTVIVDESSMLTEEMFGTLIQALKFAKRIIFVGDPNQLPPIGAGRPFVDVVRYLQKGLSPATFPKVTKSYGELTVTRRQKIEANKKTRLDMELARWFVNGEGQLDEDIFEKLQGNQGKPYITLKTWKTNEDLEALILETIKEELSMKDCDDINGFNQSLGGNVTDKGTYFNMGCGKYADEWQILAPVKNMPHGVKNINRQIHNQYRQSYMELAKRTYNKKIHAPLGSESIVYGDKVINVQNEKRTAYPLENHLDYVANGEIGIAATCFGKNADYLRVEFSSQPGYTYSYNNKDFNEETEAKLELAYALTVHKAQGSEFKKVILVLSEPCQLISRELIYTAISRQTESLVILFNDESYKLRNYSALDRSEIARRFTNLFEKPDIVKVNDKYFEAGMIHRTLRGELVRSKSEVIIANMLHQHGIDYDYEKELWIENTRKIPDFTMDDPESGELIYWEHCGMMNNAGYRKHWEVKKSFYEDNGIIEGENLIVTYDQDGSIDSQEIEKQIKRYFDIG